jgi:hypothetical protein
MQNEPRSHGPGLVVRFLTARTGVSYGMNLAAGALGIVIGLLAAQLLDWPSWKTAVGTGLLAQLLLPIVLFIRRRLMPNGADDLPGGEPPETPQGSV